MARLQTTADISEAIAKWLPESSLVMTRYQFSNDCYRVDFETCGAQAHFFISADPADWASQAIKSVVDAALHDIWARGLQPQIQADGNSTPAR